MLKRLIGVPLPGVQDALDDHDQRLVRHESGRDRQAFSGDVQPSAQ